MTEARLKALRIVAKTGDIGITAREFAERMWPDSPSWRRQSNNAHGSVTGAGIQQKGGQMLWDMWSDGLLYHSFRRTYAFCIGRKGEEELKGAE